MLCYYHCWLASPRHVAEVVAGFAHSYPVTHPATSLRHHLVSGWFRLGSLIIKQVEGLPMGNGLASALTRMVLVYHDVVFMMSPGYVLIPGHHCHCRCRAIRFCGYSIVLLEVRYVDDYLALWKFLQVPMDIASAATIVNEGLRANMHQRYFLPLEDDGVDNFLGLTLTCSSQGTVAIRPSCSSPPLYDTDFDFPATMVSNSFLPQFMKRSLALGMLARVDRFTLPASDKPAVLKEFLQVLLQHGFPQSSLRKWLLSKSSGNEWVRECFW